MEVLDFELFDALAEDTVHLTHVNELVVDVVNVASCRGCRRIRLIVFSWLLIGLVESSEFSMLSVAHGDLSLDLLGEHALQVV